MDAILTELGRRRFTNVLVEGGAGLHGSFIDANAVDEVWAFVATVIVGGNGHSPVGGSGFATLAESLGFAELQVERCGSDVWLRGRLGFHQPQTVNRSPGSTTQSDRL